MCSSSCLPAHEMTLHTTMLTLYTRPSLEQAIEKEPMTFCPTPRFCAAFSSLRVMTSENPKPARETVGIFSTARWRAWSGERMRPYFDNDTAVARLVELHALYGYRGRVTDSAVSMRDGEQLQRRRAFSVGCHYCHMQDAAGAGMMIWSGG